MSTTARHLGPQDEGDRRTAGSAALEKLGFAEAPAAGLSGMRQFVIALGGGLLLAALVAWWLFS